MIISHPVEVTQDKKCVEIQIDEIHSEEWGRRIVEYLTDCELHNMDDYVGNENGEILNSVLTTGEGPALQQMCQGIVKRYRDSGEPEPHIFYVDRDCCCESGVTPILKWFHPWKCVVRLDIGHFMRRFSPGLTTEHHPLYGTFCSKLSNCIFEWDPNDMQRLRKAKATELRKTLGGQESSDKQILASLKRTEMARYCKRRTCGVDVTKEVKS